jgi:hypothetical protein
MTTTTPSAALMPAAPVFSNTERLALAGFLAGYSGLTREAYGLDLRQFASWCHQHHLRPFSVRRSDIEYFARDLEARGRARATVTRRPPVPCLCDYARVAYDEGLAIRLLDILGEEDGLAEKKMFGGLAVLLGGNMAAGVYGDDLLVRTDPGQQDMLLAEPGTRPFDMTGRPMKGWIVVDASMCAEDEDLRRWVSRGVAYARRLPPK